jgi:hypothetical protein
MGLSVIGNCGALRPDRFDGLGKNKRRRASRCDLSTVSQSLLFFRCGSYRILLDAPLVGGAGQPLWKHGSAAMAHSAVRPFDSLD